MKLRCIVTWLGAVASIQASRGSDPSPTGIHIPHQKLYQDIVTWDEYSLKIHGERVQIFSGEVHPYRMPVHSLYLDVLQKMKAAGFNAVSIYVPWAMHEHKRGVLSFEGIRDLQPFFDAAMEAGLWVIARPGPYINSETTGGGFPGWGTYEPSTWRTSNASYVEAYQGYLAEAGAIIAKNQITKGGPVILVQSENEYSKWNHPHSEDYAYEERLIKDIRRAGITVPITTNDVGPDGLYTSVDLWGYDGYPRDFDCSNPTVTKPDAVPENYWSQHVKIAPDVPNSIYEFQAGAFDGWGGAGYEACSQLTGPEFQRVFYKNLIGMSTTILNLYMVYGGTSWGGIAHPGVYTSYDYGAAITETRGLREKLYDLKTITYFVAATPAWLTSRPHNSESTQGAFTGESALKVMQTLDDFSKTGFYTVRLSDASLFTSHNYRLSVSTSAGELVLPTLGGELTLHGKDSKIHVTDYKAGSTTLLYSTGEILTWATVDGIDVIVIYGNHGETHETAILFPDGEEPDLKVSGDGQLFSQTIANNTALAIQYKTTGQFVVEVGQATIFFLDRKNAYDFWTLYPSTSGPYAHYSTKTPLIIKGGYLLRTATFEEDGTLAVTGDLNSTTSFEFLTPKDATKRVTFNGEPLDLKATPYGTFIGTRSVDLPSARLPSLKDATWKTADSLPEISSKYSDDKWVVADHETTVNPTKPRTPVVLYSGDYGYHNGHILWRAHLVASGTEQGFSANVWGGQAFGFSVWLDSTFIGSWEGNALSMHHTGHFQFPEQLKAGSSHVITILTDHMGYDQDWVAASDSFKAPRGLTEYWFHGGAPTEITWKVQGNLGGEDYVDTSRGPLNEGGSYGERQGWHLPGFDDGEWSESSPLAGIDHAGLQFYRTTFHLDIPSGVDYPIAIAVTNSTVNPHYRAQIFVNGYQFGRYLNSIGPQKVYPIPQGILNCNGANALAISLWAQDKHGAKLDSLELQIVSKVETSMKKVVPAPQLSWRARAVMHTTSYNSQQDVFAIPPRGSAPQEM